MKSQFPSFLLMCSLVLVLINSATAKSITVGDIVMGYKELGNGKPLLLIPGFSMTMDMWDPIMVKKLSMNHIVILFDNRDMSSIISVGKTNKNYTMKQLADDVARLIDALKIREKVNVLGLSMGVFIAQELALSHPERVNSLIIFASSCGGKYTKPPITMVIDTLTILCL